MGRKDLASSYVEGLPFSLPAKVFGRFWLQGFRRFLGGLGLKKLSFYLVCGGLGFKKALVFVLFVDPSVFY